MVGGFLPKKQGVDPWAHFEQNHEKLKRYMADEKDRGDFQGCTSGCSCAAFRYFQFRGSCLLKYGKSGNERTPAHPFAMGLPP